MNAVVLLGPPGAGKGTVAEVLVDRGFTHVSTGDLLRDQIRKRTPLGLEAKKLMDQGQFVSDDVVVGMIRGQMESAAADAEFLFDGFPRTLLQAEKLDDLMPSLDATLDQVFLLECPDAVIIERLSGRRTCADCGAVYHIKFNPPIRDGFCDDDGGALIQRPDDREDTIKKRLSVYANRTAPLIAYYKARNLVFTIDAAQPIDQVRLAALEQLI
jgi:adenylate kinase